MQTADTALQGPGQGIDFGRISTQTQITLQCCRPWQSCSSSMHCNWGTMSTQSWTRNQKSTATWNFVTRPCRKFELKVRQVLVKFKVFFSIQVNIFVPRIKHFNFYIWSASNVNNLISMTLIFDHDHSEIVYILHWIDKTRPQGPSLKVFVKKKVQRCGVWQIKPLASLNQEQLPVKSNNSGFKSYSTFLW